MEFRFTLFPFPLFNRHLIFYFVFFLAFLFLYMAFHFFVGHSQFFRRPFPHLMIVVFVVFSTFFQGGMQQQKMYPKLVDQIAGGIAKVVQKATDSHVFQEFPECSILAHTDRLSIKLQDTMIHNSLQLASWRPADSARFDAITFSIRDEDNRKKEVMTAQMQSGHGICLKNGAGKTVMLVRLPTHSADSLGKLMHPSQATLYKLNRAMVGPNFLLVRASSDEAIVLRVEKVFVSLHSLGKAVGLMGTNCVYWLKAPDGQTILGHIRPKLVMKTNTIVVKFTSTQRDVQLRGAMLGTALLFLINEVYPQLRTILLEQMQQQGTHT